VDPEAIFIGHECNLLENKLLFSVQMQINELVRFVKEKSFYTWPTKYSSTPLDRQAGRRYN
jgi:hypothetical protein